MSSQWKREAQCTVTHTGRLCEDLAIGNSSMRQQSEGPVVEFYPASGCCEYGLRVCDQAWRLRRLMLGSGERHIWMDANG